MNNATVLMYFHLLHVKAIVIVNRNRKVDSHECHAHFIGKSALLSFKNPSSRRSAWARII